MPIPLAATTTARAFCSRTASCAVVVDGAGGAAVQAERDLAHARLVSRGVRPAASALGQ